MISVVPLATQSPSHPGTFAKAECNTHEFAVSILGCIYLGLTCQGYAVYDTILVTTPDATVRPPSRIANLSPSSIAIGAMSST